MNLVFLGRSGPASDYIINQLAEHWPVRVLYERGGPARYRKLRRYFRFKNFYRWPVAVLDVLAIAIYSRQIVHAIRALSVESRNVPANCTIAYCDDANDAKASKVLSDWEPELVIVYGTAILKQRTLDLAPVFLNLHGGLVPKYRNVHSEFWALKNGESVGTSVLYLNSLGEKGRVDSGDVAMAQSLQEFLLEANDLTVKQAIVANVRLAATLAVRSVQLYEDRHLPRTPQQLIAGNDSAVAVHHFNTPGFFSLMRAWFFASPKI